MASHPCYNAVRQSYRHSSNFATNLLYSCITIARSILTVLEQLNSELVYLLKSRLHRNLRDYWLEDRIRFILFQLCFLLCFCCLYIGQFQSAFVFLITLQNYSRVQTKLELRTWRVALLLQHCIQAKIKMCALHALKIHKHPLSIATKKYKIRNGPPNGNGV